MPFYVFNIGSQLLVLGIIFRILQATSNLTDIKKPKPFRNVGRVAVFGGLVIALLGLLLFVGNERSTIIPAGANITLIGIYTLIQYKLNLKNQKILEYASYGISIIGAILLIVYKLIEVFSHQMINGGYFMQYPTEYMTALITVSATFMAVSLVFMGFIASRKEEPGDWYRKIMSLSLISTLLGICAMVKALGWFSQSSASNQNWAVGLLLFQFGFMYIPLVVIGIRFGWMPKKKNKPDA